MSDLEREIKTLIVESLMLEGIAPDEIGSEEPLFVEGLGLDSIDALELGVAIRKKYGIRIESVSEDIKTHFRCVRTLACFVEQQRNGQG